MLELASVIGAAAAPLGSSYPRDRDDRWDAMLAASGKSEDELTGIFKQQAASDNSAGLYLGFVAATADMGFDELTEQAWKLATTENGGFQEAASRYAQQFRDRMGLP